MDMTVIRKVTAIKRRIVDFFEHSQLGGLISAIVGIVLILIYAWMFLSSSICEGGCWRQFDFGGRGGNPQESYLDY
ncbi:hypothetical protein HYW59_01485 [Candidatus Kaiserbacteria bacterium]|nr:hypothetical protein [Candidatus Kaiserbacteria bacterium]